MQKFFVEGNQIKGENIEITGKDVNHISNVLRLQKQDCILICNKNENKSYKTKIIDITKEKVLCKIIEEIKETTESNIKITVFQGLPKADKMEYIIQKGTELGIDEIIPLAMTRSIVKINEKDAIKKIERWQKIAEVAAKQSKRDKVPNVGKIQTIETIKEEEYDILIVAYEEEKEHTLKEILHSIQKKNNLKIRNYHRTRRRNRRKRNRNVKAKREQYSYFR